MLNETYSILQRVSSSSDVLMRSLSGLNELEIASSGSVVKGHKGGDYLDFGSFALFLFGHSPDSFVRSLTDQLSRFSGSSRTLLNQIHAEALEALLSLDPTKTLSKGLLLNTGSEACEAALKLASLKTGRKNFLHMRHSFHGKTLGALGVTDGLLYRSLSYGSDFSRALTGTDPEQDCRKILESRPAAVICEPVQGEGGVRELTDDFLREIRKACSQAGSLLIFDEIQCGLGRTGHLWACQKSGQVPDILLCGKALGAGIIPVSALLATKEAFAPLDKNPLIHTSTYATNPLACRAVLTAVDCVNSGVPEACFAKGILFKTILDDLVFRYPSVFSERRGRGLMQGLRCKSSEISGRFLKACFNRKILVTPCLSSPDVVRLSPPSVVTEKEMKQAFDIFDCAAHSVEQSSI